jgi:hypothetical protein
MPRILPASAARARGAPRRQLDSIAGRNVGLNISWSDPATPARSSDVVLFVVRERSVVEVRRPIVAHRASTTIVL